MPITRTPMIDDDGSGTTGTILNNAWKQEFYNQIDALAGGAWSSVPFDPAGFFGFTVGAVAVQRYTTLGKTMRYDVAVTGCSIAGAPSIIGIGLPPGFAAAREMHAMGFCNNGSGFEMFQIFALPGNSAISLAKFSTAGWGPTADIYLCVTLELA